MTKSKIQFNSLMISMAGSFTLIYALHLSEIWINVQMLSIGIFKLLLYYLQFLSHIGKSESWIQSFKLIFIITAFFSVACHSQERLNQSPKQWHYNTIKCNNSFPWGIPHQNEFALAFILIYSTIFEKLHMNIHFQWKSNDYDHFVDRVKSMRSDEHKFIKKIWFNCIEVHDFMILQENPSVDKCNYMVWKICF